MNEPRIVVDVSDGSIVERIDYDAYGQVTLYDNRGIDPDHSIHPFGFAGGLLGLDVAVLASCGQTFVK